MLKSMEQMAIEKIQVYYNQKLFKPHGMKFEVAQRRAAASNFTFATAIMSIKEEEVK